MKSEAAEKTLCMARPKAFLDLYESGACVG